MIIICTGCHEQKDGCEFYASSPSRCKSCVKERVRVNRMRNAAYYRAYDRKRYREQEKRQEAARKSAALYEGRRRELTKDQKAREPEKYRARNAVSNAIRDGKLERGTECFFCKGQERLQAHHHDYSLPLDVIWLCSKCHGKLHYVNGDMRRAG